MATPVFEGIYGRERARAGGRVGGAPGLSGLDCRRYARCDVALRRV